MNLNTYQALAARTINTHLTDEEKRNHALFGLAGEVGEITSIYQKAYQGHHVDLEEVKKELGDLLWFAAELATTCRMMLEDVAETNIRKLEKRYPNGFDTDRSVNREEYQHGEKSQS